MYFTKGLVTLFVGLSTVNSANALVMDYDLGKARIYEQTANDTAPITPSRYAFFSQLSSDNNTDFSSITLAGAPAGPVAYSTFNGGFSWDIFEEFANESALNTAFPDGDFKIQASTPIGVIREDVTLDGSFPEAVPYFTGPVAEALQTIDPSQSTILSWNAPAPSVSTIVFVENVVTDNEIFYLEPASGITSATIPANAFYGGGEFLAGVIFLNAEEDQRESFSTGNGNRIKGNITEIPFVVIAVPEPTTLALAGPAMLILGISVFAKQRS